MQLPAREGEVRADRVPGHQLHRAHHRGGRLLSHLQLRPARSRPRLQLRRGLILPPGRQQVPPRYIYISTVSTYLHIYNNIYSLQVAPLHPAIRLQPVRSVHL